MNNKAFTLIELLVVVAIMALLGTMSVGGYRAMQRGMEERGVVQNVNQFMKVAWQRAQIDRVPVAVYFWNETLRAETDNEPTLVVGKAGAVRRAGRSTGVTGRYLRDEFGDLRYSRLTLDEDDEEDREANASDTGVYLYQVNGSSDGADRRRSVVAQNTKLRPTNQELALGRENVTNGAASDLKKARDIAAAMAQDWAMGDGPDGQQAEKAILRSAMDRTLALLRAHRALLDRLARELRKKETLEEADLSALLASSDSMGS